MSRTDELLEDLQERIKGLEHQAELIKTVLIVKEPNTVQSAQSYDGLRKQVVAGAAERRSHLLQLVSMAVAVSRAKSVDDLVPQLQEWMDQAGVIGLASVPSSADPSHIFEDIGDAGLDGPIEVIEPAYLDQQTGAVLRLGRARKAQRSAVLAPAAPRRLSRSEGDEETLK